MGGMAPIVYGVIADHTSRAVVISASALTAAIIIPLVVALRPALASPAAA
jgi:MFS transporter, FSR family, fosmidomycin resistance protein